MSINRKFLTLLPMLAFAALLLGGLVVTVLSLNAFSSEDWATLKDPGHILSGASTKRFTKLLNQHFLLGPAFNEVERGMLWNLTGDLGPSVRSGCKNWLFLTDELEVYPDRIKSAQFRAKLAAKLNENLQHHGIKLLMVVVPDKTRIESTHLCGLNRSHLFKNRIVNWLAAIKSKGVETLNLTPALSAMKGERYYHTDTHWNEAGANAAAQAVAADLGKLKWADLAAATRVKLNTQRRPRPGDLVHLAGLSGLPALLRPKVEWTQVTTVPPVTIASDDLFGDAGLPTIALIGTSYSRNSNFVPFLEHHLGELVANLAKDGGDFSGAATVYLSGNTYRDTPPKIVIWEIPERVIESPLKKAEKKWLKTMNSAKI
ncbi:MAG: hypothetical protein R8K48_01860 [Gallionella sp.]